MNLSTASVKALKEQFSNQAKAYGIGGSELAVGQTYAATPTIAQTIYDKLIEDGNDFLQKINVHLVPEIKGEKVGMSLTGSVASRTEITPTTERTPKKLVNLDAKTYELFETEFDVAIGYKTIDQWAKFKDFQRRYMEHVRKLIGNDLLRMGWAGTSVATTTSAGDLSDVQIGWLQLIRTFNAGSQYLLGGTKGIAGAVTLVGPDTTPNKTIGEVKNLDAAAKIARNMLPVFHRNRDDLVLLVSANVFSYQEDSYYELNANTPTEKAMMSGQVTKGFNRMIAVSPAFFPDDTILVTTLDNLSIYIQDSSVRRTQKDKPSKNEFQDFNSMNMGYVVEDEELCGLIQGITYE